MHGVALRIKKSQKKATKILVDQQSQFNKAQRTLAEFYSSAREIEWQSGPGMPRMDLKSMPDVPIEFSSSAASAGLELVDIHLWVFKRFMEEKDVAPELYALVRPQLHRGRTDEISIKAIAHRWTMYFDRVPELEEMSAEQVNRAREILRIDEERRLKAVNSDRLKH